MHYSSSMWTPNSIDQQLIKLALLEDLGTAMCDITTSLFFPTPSPLGCAQIISKQNEPIIICGLALLSSIFEQLNISCQIHSQYQDGACLEPRGVLAELEAPINSLLMCERIVLNFLQRLCGIASFTKKWVDLISHTNTKILDTRKTLPGFRHLEKYAVQCGGGMNHRMGLYDAIMIKDTHVDFFGGMEHALAQLPDNILQRYPVIIEVRDKHELAVVLEKGINRTTRILLDNMSVTALSECVALCANRIPTEASGNIDLSNIIAIAETGVDFASVGKITHSAPHIDLSLKCKQ